MTDKKHRFFHAILVLLIVLGFAAGCTPENTSTPTEILPTAVTTSEPASTPTSEPTAASTTETTKTPQPLILFLDEPIPNGIINSDIPQTYQRSYFSDNTLWFGPSDLAPQGEVLHTTAWIYALAAPFNTIIDDITFEELQMFWRGVVDNPDISTRSLYIPETIKGPLEYLWGIRDGSIVKAVETIPDPNTLWEENAWAIIPFDQLDPKLKVISIDGISPLFKEFTGEGYSLTIHYQVAADKELNSAYSSEDIQTLISGINTSNRDTDKMTTLIMTGVTALVRETAYKMEEKGVLYPGEEIVDWLSEADLTHISNEISFYEDCPFPDPTSRILNFCSDPKYFQLLEFIGADIIELTGNHNNDVLVRYGVDVGQYNIDLYLDNGMVYYGGGLDLEDAMSPLTLTHNGNNLAFIGCNASGPDFAWATETGVGAAPCDDFGWMADEIERLKSEGFIPIATLQYYEDYYNYPETHHIRDFGLLANSGAVIVNGSQAHRPKGMAFSSGAFIDYGLGNLFFDQMGVLDAYGNQIIQTRWEIIQRHTFYDGRLISTELLTAMLEDYAQPRPMTSSERAVFLEELFTASGWETR